MANQPQSVTPLPAKAKRKRSPSIAKPAFFIIQILDESGTVQSFDKKRIKLLAIERDANKVVDYIDNETYPHAIYIRGIVPVARQSAPRDAAPASPPAAA
jgi:hypothetical protein